MYTKADLQSDLRKMGVRPDDTVLIHTSMKAIGMVEGGADAVIDAFCEYLTDGLFIVPTHTWATVNADHPVYDVRSAEPCIGWLPRTAAKRPDGVRSLHPTHSVWAHGRDAEAFVRGEEKAGSPGAPGFCWDKLADVGAKILLIGVGHNRNTFIHSVDERAALPDRLGDAYEAAIIDRAGQESRVMMRSHRCSRTSDVSQFYVNFEKPLCELGAQTMGRLGDADVRIVDAKKCQEIVLRIYGRAAEDIFTELCELPEALYRP